MSIGFIGLGRMGQGMARNLVKGGVDLVVLDRSADAMSSVVSAGAKPAASVAELASRVDVLFTSLPGPPEVEDVVLGEDGVLQNMRPGLALFELSTSSLILARRLHEAFGKEGCAMLDAPVSGGPAGAASGQMTIWVGGQREVFDRHVELLRMFASAPHYVGAIGAGTITKLTHNMVGYMIVHSLAEGFSMAVKAGLDPLDLWQALRLGVVGKASPLNMLINQFLPGNYEPPAFALKLAHKDMSLATTLGRELGVPMRLANLTLEEMSEALGRGFGDQDSRAFLKLQLERAGVEIMVEPDRLQEVLKAR